MSLSVACGEAWLRYSSFMISGTNQFFKFQTKMVRCHVDEKKWVLELGELEYHKKWYLPKYFRNSVADPIISKISANGPFCPGLGCGTMSSERQIFLFGLLK